MPIGFAVACKKFFGQKPGQDLQAFSRELKALTPKDKVELRSMLADALGEEVTLAAEPAQ
jgi:hypothetical protein